MLRSTKMGLAAGAFLLLVGVVAWLFSVVNGPQAPAEELIAQTLNEAKAAARRRDAGGILDSISDDFSAGGFTKKNLRLIVVRSLRQSRGTDFDVSVLRPRILPIADKPDSRLVYSKFDVFYSDNGESIWGTNPIALVMRKENKKKWFFFREPKWRIVGAPGLPPSLGDLDSLGGGSGSGSGLPTLTPLN